MGEFTTGLKIIIVLGESFKIFLTFLNNDLVNFVCFCNPFKTETFCWPHLVPHGLCV